MTVGARDAVARGQAMWANPSSPHAEGRAARAALEAARAAVGAAYGWRGEVLFTSGASESLGIALGRSVAARRVISAVEHDAAIRAAGVAEVIAVGAEGLVDPSTLNPFVSSAVEKPAPGAGFSTALETNGRGTIVAVQWANSETGVRQPIAEIARAVHAAGALLLVDAAQMPVSAELADHADFVALSAHKRGGPPGVGALLVRDLATLHPTGGQERGYRAGTENLPAAMGYAAALAEPEPDHSALRQRLDDAIVRSGGEIVGAGASRHPGIGSYRMPGVASASQLIRFDMDGIAVSAGSACASGSLKPSHVLRAMGWSQEAMREVVRVSFGRSTTDADVDRFIAAWRGTARAARRIAA